MAMKPDFVFRKQKVVIFVDGEFWHGHPTRAKIPQTNSEFWIKKIADNKARDRFQTRLLQRDGWTVIRIWQRDIKSLS
jgi:DNA mismatch endonuclease (patch repair protein)